MYVRISVSKLIYLCIYSLAPCVSFLNCVFSGKRPKYAFLPEVNAKADHLYWLCKECVENKDYANLPGVFQAAFTSMKSCVEKISKFFKRR